MFLKNLRYAYLLDFYGQLFDEHTREVMQSYYNDDLSLAEVAEGVGISRQGVRHIIKKGEEMLEFYEERLGLMKKEERLADAIQRLEGVRDSLKNSEDSLGETIEDIISSLSNNN